MDTQQAITSTQEKLSTRAVFGEPIRLDGVTLLPAAFIRGGAGGGEGRRERENAGSGMGFGLRARPAGVFVTRGESVSWRPAVDVNRVILGGQLVAMTALLALRPLLARRFGAGSKPARFGGKLPRFALGGKRSRLARLFR
ncbi:MAG TPA: hypothetical protein VKY73_13055 [Polyangiaceae bacterium]|nr:hypothetical protein [Polyangiaceae bacterium]